jgi:uncharacterized protein
MEYRSIKGFTGLGQIGFLFAFLGLGVVLAGAVQALFIMQMLPAGVKLTDSAEVMKAMALPQNIGIARASQVIGTMLLLFVPAALWSFASHGKNPFWLGFSRHINIFQIMLGFMIIFSAGLAAAPLADLSKSIVAHFPSFDAIAKRMENMYNEQAAALSNLKNIKEYIVALFIMAFFPAMFEEVFFRGALQNLLVRWWKAPMIAIIVTSILFSLIHMSIYLFLSRAILGFALGYMFYVTKNIWVNIIAHFINNAIALTMLYSMRVSSGKIDLQKLEPELHWSASIAGVVVLIGLFYLLKKYSTKNVEIIESEENYLIGNHADPHGINSFANHLN